MIALAVNVKLTLSGSVTPMSAGARVTVWPSSSVRLALVSTGGSLAGVKLTAAVSVFEFSAPSLAVRLNEGPISLPSSTNWTRPPESWALVNEVIGVPGAELNWKNPPAMALAVNVKLALSGSVTPMSAGVRVTVWPSVSVRLALLSTGGSLAGVKLTAAVTVFEFSGPSLAVRSNEGAISLPSSTNCTRPPVS